MRRQDTTMHVTGLHITPDRQAIIGQAVLLTLAKHGVEIDGVRITFKVEENF